VDCGTIGGASGSGSGLGNNGGGGGTSRDSCAAKDPCGGRHTTTMAAAADQALVGSVTKKLTKDIDALSEKLKAEAKM